MLTPEQVFQVRSLRAKRYTTGDIMRLTGLTAEQLKEAMAKRYYGSHERGPEQVIDGEPIGDRIERLKREIREGRLVIQRTSR